MGLIRYFSGFVNELLPTQRLVFGSNLAGVHGAGAARQAHKQFGAEWGVGEGPTGQCYAIPTKDCEIRTRPLKDIHRSVIRFMGYALEHPELEFLVTPIGCGLAGYDPAAIGPMFGLPPDNLVLPESFKPYVQVATLRMAQNLYDYCMREPTDEDND
jgi:hypothetical protein